MRRRPNFIPTHRLRESLRGDCPMKVCCLASVEPTGALVSPIHSRRRSIATLCANLRVLCVSVVSFLKCLATTETQRTRRLHGELEVNVTTQLPLLCQTFFLAPFFRRFTPARRGIFFGSPVAAFLTS